MITVYKYQLPIDDVVTLRIPKGAQLLHVAEQVGIPCLWARVDSSAPAVRRKLRFAGTGHPLEKEAAIAPHVGSFFMHGGALVFHIFDLGEEVGDGND